MKKLTQLVDKLCKWLCYVGVAACVVLMCLVTFDVLKRFITNEPLIGTYELVQYLLCVIIYAGLAYCQTQHGHMHVTMIITKMSRVPCMVAWAVSSLISCAMGIGLTVACWEQAMAVKAQGIYSSLLHIPQYPFQIFCGICMIFFAAVLLLDGIKGVVGIFNKEYSDEITSHWVG